ncbi:condensin complex subunit 1 [Ixodes scapularis]
MFTWTSANLGQIRSECEGLEGLAPADCSWMLMLPDIQEALKGHCNGHDASTEIQQDEAEEDEGVLLSEVLQEIRTLLKKGFYTQAVAVVKKAITMYPESNLFCASESSPEAPESQADEEQENGESDKPCLVDVLRKIYQGGSRPDDPLVDNPEAFCRDENPIPEIGGSDAVAEANGAVLDDLSKQKIVVRYLEDCVHFAKQMKTIVPTLCDLLRSPTVSDVQETIAFFVSAHRFGVEDASVGLREMLPLMWSAEAGVREAVVSSYREVYFDAKSGGNSRSKVSDIADSLSLLVSTATADELLSLKKLVVELVKTGDVSPLVLRMLWERYTLQGKDATQAQSLAAAQLLAMAASADVKIVKKNLDILISVGLGERAKADLNLCKHTCSILMQLANEIKSKNDNLYGRPEFSEPIERTQIPGRVGRAPFRGKKTGCERSGDVRSSANGSVTAAKPLSPRFPLRQALQIPLPKKSTSLAWKAAAENRTSDVKSTSKPTPRTTIVPWRPSAKREARRRLHSTPAEQFPGATAMFWREFVDYAFGVTCAVCDPLWVAGNVCTIGGVSDEKKRETGACALRQCIEYSSTGLFSSREWKG